jgi:hypothetical protein
VVLGPLACWDCGLESHRRHGCLSVVSVVCCQVEVSASNLSLVQRSPTDCGASLCVIRCRNIRLHLQEQVEDVRQRKKEIKKERKKNKKERINRVFKNSVLRGMNKICTQDGRSKKRMKKTVY